ncbi:MAG: transporter [candidate division KSB1 bacterium]|nr:transporter [candidate division KSB1 bacterium]
MMSTVLRAQTHSADAVHLFQMQSFFKDAVITTTPYGEGAFFYGNSDVVSNYTFGVRGGYDVSQALEVGAALAFASVDPDFGEGQSGLTDLLLSARYKIRLSGNTKLVAGGFLTLPMGAKDIGENHLDFGAFGALRHPLNSGVVLTANLGLDFIEIGSGPAEDRKLSLALGGGVIYPVNSQVAIVGELNLETETEYALLSGGVDYQLKSGSRLRGTLGFGLNDGAPDFLFGAGFLMSFPSQ